MLLPPALRTPVIRWRSIVLDPAVIEPRVLAALWALDGVLIGLHCLVEITPPPDPEWLLITTSWGLAELVHYVEAMLAVGVLVLTISRRSTPALDLAVAGGIATLTVFEMFELHRRAPAVAWVVAACFAVAVASLMRGTLASPDDPAGADRKFEIAIAGAVVAFGVFAIGANSVHDLIGTRDSTAGDWGRASMKLVLDVIEEGGEMLVMSAVLALCLARATAPRSPDTAGRKVPS